MKKYKVKNLENKIKFTSLFETLNSAVSSGDISLEELIMK